MSRNNVYSKIARFGPNEYSPVNNPLTYCLGKNMDIKFLHGSSAMSIDGQQSKACQAYLSQYCAENWDGFCEFASKNTNTDYPNNWGTNESPCKDLTAGEMLVNNTAKRKYLKTMNNGVQKFAPFDPNVASSPLISYWVPGSGYSDHCVPVYSVNPDEIDNDVVMHKLLENPKIAPDILININNTMRREGTLNSLEGTKLGNFYSTNAYFKSKGGLA